jgi:hypothetical protein
VAITLVTGKSFPVQSSLWLVPLVALCGIRWRDHLVWAGAEAMHFVAVWLYVGGLSKPDRGMPPQWYAVFLLLRILAVLYLVWRVWQKAAERDPAPPPYLEGAAAEGDAALARPLGVPGEARVTASGLDPDSDAVVDELAGDLTDAPDRLVVNLG